MSEYVCRFITYSGMTYDLCTGTLAECRGRAKKRKLFYKKKIGGVVSVLKAGREWECIPPDTALLVTDFDGYLKISKVKNDRA